MHQPAISKSEEQAQSFSELQARALALLSRREHAATELAQKLARSGASPELIAEVVAWCQCQNYQSDQRYCTMLIRSKINKGYGPLYVMQAAREQGLDKELVTATLSELDIDWTALAKQQYQSKFGDVLVKNYQEQQKRMGFLQRRGFTAGQIQYALKHSDS